MIPVHYYITFIVFVFSVIYRLSHSRRHVHIQETIPEFSLGYVNGVGSALLGKFRYDGSENLRIYYVVLTVFFLPIVPVSCVIATEDGREPSGCLLGSTTNYRIYGTTRWNFWEILNLYALRWGLLLSVMFLSFIL